MLMIKELSSQPESAVGDLLSWMNEHEEDEVILPFS